MIGLRLREIALPLIVLVIGAVAFAPTLARASNPDPSVCIEDGGGGECTAPMKGTYSYAVHEPLAIGTAYSEQDLHALISGYAGGYCSNETQQPPYTWTPTSQFFPLLTWDTTIVENGVTGHCDGGPVNGFTMYWQVVRAQPESCPPPPWVQSTVSPSYPTGRCIRFTPAQNCQPGQVTPCSTDPVDFASGNETESETDYEGSGSDTLRFVRSYNYLGTIFGPGTPNGVAGLGWSHTFERRLWAMPNGVIRALRQDGSDRFFFPGTAGYKEFGTGIEQLVAQTSGGWVLTDNNDTQETYDSSGSLQAIRFRGGRVLSLFYSTAATPPSVAPSAGLLLSVVDTFGHQLGFTYNGQGLMATMTDPSGGVYTYSYTGNLLASVTYPDSSRRQYLYNESAQTGGGNFPYALTGLIDENGVRFATIAYNPSGKAVSSQLAGGVESYTIVQSSIGAAGGVSYVKDPLGVTRTLHYTGVGGVVKYNWVEQPCPRCPDMPNGVGYDANGNVTDVQDYAGNLTTRVFDLTRNLETSRTEASASANARTITTTWNPSYRVPTQIVEPNHTTSYTYDSSGNLLTRAVTDTASTPNTSRTWTYTYNTYGQVLTARSPRTDVNSTTIYTYYSCATGFQCGELQTVTDAAGHVTIYNTYNGHGQPLTITDADGVVIALTYDARQRLTSRNVGGETTRFSYYPTGLLQTITLPDGSSLTYSYDGAHRLTQISDGLGNRITYTLDAVGNRTAENTYDPSGVLHRAHTRAFNALNELYQDINAANTSAVTTTYGYDANGNQSSVAAPLSRNSSNAYDALNRLKQVTDPASGITKFGYDASDNLVSVTDPRTLVTSYTYNAFGDLLTQLSPDTGSTTNTYDSAGNLATSTDARGAVSTYTYDALNRVTSVAYSLGGSTDQTITFTYDTGTNGVGRLAGASDASHSLSWGYDALGRVITKSQTVSGVTKSAGYSYTSGDLTTLTTPSGQTVSYGYNTNHQITSLAVNGTTVLSNVRYEPLGPVSAWNWGNSTAVTRTYTGDGVVSQISSNGFKTYSYDNALRITGISDTSAGSSNWTYGYDSLDRLTSGTNGTITRGWTYDANGNRLTETGSSPSTYSIATTSNRIAGITGALVRTYGYDAAGHATSNSSMTATYDNAGRLKTVSTGSLTETLIYNALGQRIATSGGAAGTILYWYDEQGHLLGEYDGSGNLIEETVWLGDVPVATLQPGGSGVTVCYVHTDQLNTPRQVTRPADNAQMWTWFSDPFGTDAANSNPSGGGAFTYNLRFPGQVFDRQVGLHLNYFRDFDPATGRYIQSDLLGLRAGVNTYAYVGSNPISRIDPFGLMPPPIVPPTIGQSAAQQNVNYLVQNPPSPQQFYNLVKNNGPWDYKQYGSDYQNFGNYNFGVAAAASGLFTLQAILQQAGRAQCTAGTSNPKWGRPDLGPPYGDDPNDQHWITEGWNDYKSGMYGPVGLPRSLGLYPAATSVYSNFLQPPINYCSSNTQCW